jgi:hypothetical protein
MGSDPEPPQRSRRELSMAISKPKLYRVDLNWRGWVDDPADVPSAVGMYAVWAARVTREGSKWYADSCTLLWIGKADGEGGLRGRVANHERRDDWDAACPRGTQLVFTWATTPFAGEGLLAVECGLISAHQPCVNVQCKACDAYDYPYNLRVTHRGATMGEFEADDLFE